MSPGIESFTIKDHDDAYAPPERPVLEVSVVGDVTFLTIRKTKETPTTEKRETVVQIGVPTTALYNGLAASIRSDPKVGL